MENTEKVEVCVEKEAAEAVLLGDSKPKEEESIGAEVIETTESAAKVVESQANLEVTPKAEQNDAKADATSEAAQLIKDADIESKTDEKVTELVKHEVEAEPPQTIEECDTGGDEIADVSLECEPTSTNVPLEPVGKEEVVPVCQDDVAEEQPILLTELKTVPHEAQPIIEIKADEDRSDVVAIDDDDDDVDDDGADEEDDDDDGDDEDEDEDEEDDDAGLYLDDDMEKIEKRSSSSRDLRELPHPLDDFDEDEYDEVDDDEEDDRGMVVLKDESNVAFVIGSSDEEEVVQRAPIPLKKQEARKYEAMDDDLDYEDDDDEDDYDDDDLMNAAVTSVTKALSSTASTSSSPIKKQLHARKQNLSRLREAEQISVLTRRINYGRIVKKKSLNWLYNKKKREAYKLILPKFRSAKAAMRSDQSGGLLHLKISQSPVTSIDSKALTKASASAPIIARVESQAPIASTIPQRQSKDEYVIDLDSSPEKPREKSISTRKQSDDQRDSEISVKKPPDFRQREESTTMQQTDKVRDSIQKSAEQVEEVKSVARLSCEQNKENLQSNKSVKNEKDDETPKNETEPKDTTTPTEDAIMDIVDDASENTIKAKNFIISSVSSLDVDIKEEKIDETVTTPPTTEEITASKVTIEDVDEKETPRTTTTPQSSSVGATKRRRSSSFTVQDRNKISKPSSGAAADEGDDEEYVHPTKKLREELQSSYPAHDRILNEYIEKTNNDSIDTIQRHIEQMLSEIQTLNDMIKAKEVEWNSMLHLKKVKEEICFRLTRRKQCMEIMATKVGEAGHSAGLDEDYQGNESILGFGKTTPLQQNPHLSSTPIAATINSIASNICNFTAVSSSSSAAPTTAQLIVQNRANMKSSDLVKEKANTQRLQRLLVSSNILPKPAASPTSVAGGSSQQGPSTNGGIAPSSSNQPILNSYLTSSDSVQQLVDMMNGHHNNHSGLLNGGVTGSNNNSNSQAAMVGRQGPFKDVRSIIADFRQQHPEVVPRRGRRVKNSNNSNLSDSNTILGNALKSDTNSRPSSNDSSSHSLSNTNQSTTTHNNVNTFKDVLAPFAKSQGAASLRSTSGHQQNPPYPEVTLHPVSTPLNASGGQDQPTGSLLHGILTKFSRPTESVNTKSVANQTSASYISNFSPTLARLLTAPERISASGGGGSSGNQGHHSSAANVDPKIPGFGVNLSKVVGHNSEITITPVMNSMHQQSMLQHQLQQQQQLKEVLSRVAAVSGSSSGTGLKEEHFLKLSSLAAASAANDDDAEDSVDRLVIDEGVDSMAGGEDHQRIAPHAIGQEFNENEVPVCQGCKKHEAQFVCAGCGNQWYCSRECQVTAWDDHSEVCTG